MCGPTAAEGGEDGAKNAAGDPLLALLNRASSDGAKFWRGLCPWLHVEDEGFRQAVRRSVWPYAEGGEALADQADAWGERLVNEGYFIAQPEELSLPWAVDVAAVARGVEALIATGLPPSSILAYDEPWAMASQLDQLVRVVSGGNEPIMDWAAFHVRASPSSPSSSSSSAPAGWPPHRDRGSDDSVHAGFRSDGSPRYTTFWLPLTDATPESSCLMVVPKEKDPGYSEGDRGKSPLTTIFSTPEAFQHIRPLPTRAGGLVAFSHRLLHWGSVADPRAPAPRIAVAFAAADPGFAEPYFSRSHLPFPSLGLRVALVAGQALAYCSNEALVTTRERAEAFWNLFHAQAVQFGPSFRSIVAKHRAFLEQTLPQAGSEEEGHSCKRVEEESQEERVEEAQEERVEEVAADGDVEDLFAGIIL